MADLERARESGYAVDNEENTVGLRCLASPVFDEFQRPIAAVSVSEVTSKTRNARRGATGDMIRAVASKITRVYGGLELSEYHYTG
jgi:IclR family acetate operon transcriptional repressor